MNFCDYGKTVALVVLAMLFHVSGCAKEDQTSFSEYKPVSTQDSLTAPSTNDKPMSSSSSYRETDVIPLIAHRPDEDLRSPAATPLMSGTDFYRIRPATLIAPQPDQFMESSNEIASTDSVKANSVKVKDKPVVRKVKLLIPDKTFDLVSPNDSLRVGFDDLDLLKVLNMEPVTPNAPELFPDWLKELDGKQVRIRGYMRPAFQEEGITHFLLVRDTEICCFRKQPKVYDMIPVFLKSGVSTRYMNLLPFDVVGTFQIKPWVTKKGELKELYIMKDAMIMRK